MPRYTHHTHARVRTHCIHMCVYTLHTYACVHTCPCTHVHMHMCACSHVHTITRVHAHLFTYILFSTHSHAHPHPPCRDGSGPVALLRPYHMVGFLSLLITQGRAGPPHAFFCWAISPRLLPCRHHGPGPSSGRLPRQCLCSSCPNTAKTLHSWWASIFSWLLRSSLAASASVRKFWLCLGVPAPPPPPTPRVLLGPESELHHHSLPAQGPGFSLPSFLCRCHSLSVSGPAVCPKAGHLTSLSLSSHTLGQGHWTLRQLCTQLGPIIACWHTGRSGLPAGDSCLACGREVTAPL